LEEARRVQGTEGWRSGRDQFPPFVSKQRKADHPERAGFFFSAGISEISAKTGFTGYHREKEIPNEILRYLNNLVKFKFFI
jgi:hypothetical protein